MTILIGFGEGLRVVVAVLVMLCVLSLAVSAGTAGLWWFVAHFVSQPRMTKAWLTAAVVLGMFSGPLYMADYGERLGCWLLPDVLGPLVVTVAVLVSATLIQADSSRTDHVGRSPRLRLRTLLSLVAVVAIVMATLAPAFRSA